MREYVTLDLETTGLEPKRDRIIEIGAVKVSNGVVIGEYTTLIDPQLEIPEQISKLTGISNDMVQGKPLIQKVIGEFLEFCGDLPLLGHNILFDYSFVKHQAVNCGLEFEKEAVDTLKIARAVLSDLPSRSLQNLRQHFEIPQGDAHRALEDARTTYHLYERLFQEYGQSKPELFCSKPLIYKVKKQGPMTPAQKRYLQDLVKYHRINLNVNPESLTKNEASRLIDEILSTYGKIMR